MYLRTVHEYIYVSKRCNINTTKVTQNYEMQINYINYIINIEQ